MSLKDLQRFWNTKIEPDLSQEGINLETRPTYDEITEAGYSGIAYTLREHHDLTLSQFLATVGYTQPDSDDTYPWGIDDETTVRELEWFLETNLRREGLVDRTIQTKRSRLARFVRTYDDLHGSADLVARIREDSTKIRERDERERVRAVFDEWGEPNPDLETAESRYKHLLAVRQFYDRLVSDRDATFNPAADAPHERRWKNETPDNADRRDPPALEAEDVRALAEAADSASEQLLVVATCAWGLRRGEVASLSIDQFGPTWFGHLEYAAANPHIVFDERKNGPGSVSIHYGLSTLAKRWAQLANQNSQGGYLFPSSVAASGHVTPDTITARFRRLAERADVAVRGETPTPQYGRRFWYRTYTDAVERLSRHVQAVADEQGSTDDRVVLENYLGEEEARNRRREYMREQLAKVFER